jgi:hypothetical protein
MTIAMQNAGKRFKQHILEPDVISKAVIKQIVTRTSGQVIIPSSHTVVSMLRAFPLWLQEVVRSKGSKGLVRLRRLPKQEM